MRAMNGYKLPAWIRVSVGTMPENRRFVTALGKVLAKRRSPENAGRDRLIFVQRFAGLLIYQKDLNDPWEICLSIPSPARMQPDQMSAAGEAQELARLEELRRYQILDTPPEPVFDDLTRLAAQICGAPMAAISFVDHDRQWFKSRYGLDDREYPCENSFCAQAIKEDDLMIVPDPTRDERFLEGQAVVGPTQARFYAGAPLRMPSGHVLGALSVLDRRPRALKSSQQESLRAIARQVVAQMELRRSIAELERAAAERARVEAELRKSEDRFQKFMNNSPALAYIKDELGRFVYAERTDGQMFRNPGRTVARQNGCGSVRCRAGADGGGKRSQRFQLRSPARSRGGRADPGRQIPVLDQPQVPAARRRRESPDRRSFLRHYRAQESGAGARTATERTQRRAGCGQDPHGTNPHLRFVQKHPRRRRVLETDRVLSLRTLRPGVYPRDLSRVPGAVVPGFSSRRNGTEVPEARPIIESAA